MRKRRTTLPPPADEPEPETDGASPSKRRAFGKKVAAAVSRIEAVDAAAKPVGEELPIDRQPTLAASPVAQVSHSKASIFAFGAPSLPPPP